MAIKINSEDLLERFLTYVQIDTQSDCHSDTTPSTQKQWDLVRVLEKELEKIGLKDVHSTEFGYLLATLPATSKKQNVPRIAFFAHLDTSDACPGKARPIVHRNYGGQPIILPDDPTQRLTVEDTPLLAKKLGEDIITASGTTLLGADDKAGIAIIMAAINYLTAHPEIEHGEIKICFNPDEEIGRGTHKLDLNELDAEAAYTLDAENLGELNYESFSADQATLTIIGIPAHPGSAKGVMVNALRLAAEFIHQLPMQMAPESTSGRDGFIHPIELLGSAEKATLRMILRDFELDGLETKTQFLHGLVEILENKEPRAKFALEVSPQYRNMRYWLEKDLRPVEFAIEAVKLAGLSPIIEAIRGGTDGSQLTERGLPTPNIFTGFHYVHSLREWVSLQDMVKAAETLVHLAALWEKNG